MKGIEKKRFTEKNLLDSVNFREPEKVPVGMELQNWAFAYNGGTFAEVIDDAALAAERYCSLTADVEIDFMFAPPGQTKPMRAFEALGVDNYVLGSDGCTIGHNQAKEHTMSDADYPAFIENPAYFWKEKLTKERVPAFQGNKAEAYENLKKSLCRFKDFADSNAMVAKHFAEEGLFVLSSKGARFDVPLDTLFDRVRGMRNTLIDLRRRPQMVKEACDRIHEMNLSAMRVKPNDMVIPEDEFICGCTVYHSACFLSMPQFQQHFIEYLKKDYLSYFERGGRMFIKGEGAFIRTMDQYRDLPKGAFVVMLEADDPFEVKEKIGDWATIATGIKGDLLKYGTKEQCIDYVKACYDKFAPGGGFVFLQDKPLMAATDGIKENVIATWEFANEYGSRK